MPTRKTKSAPDTRTRTARAANPKRAGGRPRWPESFADWMKRIDNQVEREVRKLKKKAITPGMRAIVKAAFPPNLFRNWNEAG